jgi:ssDNA-binding Zn-finger/Zn-ribbon topoisomerase 1
VAKRKKKKGGPVHYAVHKRDRQTWGGQTMCGARKVTMTTHPDKITCPKCIHQTAWTSDEVRAACGRPLFLCGRCDAGQLVFTEQTKIDYELSCTNCDHKERRVW